MATIDPEQVDKAVAAGISYDDIGSRIGAKIPEIKAALDSGMKFEDIYKNLKESNSFEFKDSVQEPYAPTGAIADPQTSVTAEVKKDYDPAKDIEALKYGLSQNLLVGITPYEVTKEDSTMMGGVKALANVGIGAGQFLTSPVGVGATALNMMTGGAGYIGTAITAAQRGVSAYFTYEMAHAAGEAAAQFAEAETGGEKAAAAVTGLASTIFGLACAAHTAKGLGPKLSEFAESFAKEVPENVVDAMVNHPDVAPTIDPELKQRLLELSKKPEEVETPIATPETDKVVEELPKEEPTKVEEKPPIEESKIEEKPNVETEWKVSARDIKGKEYSFTVMAMDELSAENIVKNALGEKSDLVVEKTSEPAEFTTPANLTIDQAVDLFKTTWSKFESDLGKLGIQSFVEKPFGINTMEVQRGEVRVNYKNLKNDLNSKLIQGETPASAVNTIIFHEFLHTLTVDSLTQAAIHTDKVDINTAKNLARTQVIDISKTANSGMIWAARKLYGKAWEQMSDYQRGHELVRMVLEKKYRGKITEQVWAAVAKVANWLVSSVKKLDSNSPLHSVISKVENRAKELGIALDKVGQDIAKSEPSILEIVKDNERKAEVDKMKDFDVEQELPPPIEVEPDPDIVELVKDQADSARALLSDGPGAASEVEFQQARASIGAQLLLEAKNKTDWKQKLLSEFDEGALTPKEVKQIWEDANSMLADYHEAQVSVKPISVKTQINQEVGLKTETASTQVKELQSSKTSPERVSEIQQNLSSYISRFDGLKAYLQGQAKGAKYGKAAMRGADRALQRSHNLISKTLTEYARERLTNVKDRGKAMNAIVSALARRSILSDPNVTSVSFIKAIDKIDKIAEWRKRKDVTSKIEALDKKLESSKTIDAGHRDFWYRYRALLPENYLKDYPTSALEALHDQMLQLEASGVNTLKLTELNYKQTIVHGLLDLASSDSAPHNTRSVVREAGTELTLREKVADKIARGLTYANRLDLATVGRDVMLDILDNGKAKYQGFLSKQFGAKLDLALNRAYSRIQKDLEWLNSMRQSITPIEAEQIHIYGKLQEGFSRLEIVNRGANDGVVMLVENHGLPPKLQNIYNRVRTYLDGILPEYRESLRVTKNQTVGEIKNFIPDRVELDQWVDNSLLALFGEEKAKGDYARHASADAAKSRQKGAQQKLHFNLFDNLEDYIREVSFHIEVQPQLKWMADIVRSDVAKEKWGDQGQDMLIDWLKTVATQGRKVGDNAFFQGIARLRRNTAISTIGLNPIANLKHLSYTAYAMAEVGPIWWVRGAMIGLFSKEGQQFLKENFAVIKERSGGMVDERELAKSIAYKSMVIARTVDHINTSAVAMAGYLRGISERGYDWRNFDGVTVIEDVVADAHRSMRRAVASPMPSDVPLVLSRGTGLGEVSEVGRVAFQYQTPVLDQWSYMRNELYHSVKGGEGLNILRYGTAIAAASFIEAGVKVGGSRMLLEFVKQVNPSLRDKDEDEEGNPYITEAEHDILKKAYFFRPAFMIKDAYDYNKQTVGTPFVDTMATIPLDIAKAIKDPTPAKVIHAVGASAKPFVPLPIGTITNTVEDMVKEESRRASRSGRKPRKK